MKTWILVLIALAGSVSAQQSNTDMIPASSGLNLGHSNQTWNAFLNNVTIFGTCTLATTGQACSGQPIGSYIVSTLPTNLVIGALAQVTDSTGAGSCTSGGGSQVVLCRWNGVIWQTISGSGTPAGTNTQLQFNNSGAFGAISNVAAGSALVSNGASSLPIFQSKQAIDVRDFGVDCTDTNDSTTALNNAIAAAEPFGKVVFPKNCKVKISGSPSILINRTYGLEIEMLGRQGNSCDQGGSSGLDYQQTYSSGNTVISINDSQRLRFTNLVLYLNGNADIGLLIDQDVSTPPITTDNIFQGLCIYNNTATRNSAFNGIYLSKTATSNVESQRIRDTTVVCSNSAPTSATSNGNGIALLTNSNAVNEEISNIGSVNCSVTLNSPGGQELAFTHLLDSTGNANTNVIMPSLNGGLLFSRFENSNIGVQQVGGSPTGPTLIMGNDFTNLGTVMDCNNNGCGAVTILNNEKDSVPGNWFNVHSNPSNSGLFAINNRNFSWAPLDWQNGAIVFPDFSTNVSVPLITSTVSLRLTPHYKNGAFNSNMGSPFIDLQSNSNNSSSQVDDYYIQSMPTGNFGAVSASTLVFGHSPTNGISPWYSFQGTMSGVTTNGISTPNTPTVTNECSGGGSTWTYKVVAHDGTGTTVGSAAASTATGCSNLASGANRILVASVAGCTYFDIYRTVSGGTPATTGKIGQLPCYAIGIASVTPDGEASTNIFRDTGLAGDSTSPPTANTTGTWTFAVTPTANGGTPTVSGTGACATTSTQIGGKWAGLVTCTGTTGASTLVITPGLTATNGFRCPADDETTVANKLTQTAQNTTTCTISGTVNANDVIAFGPIVAF